MNTTGLRYVCPICWYNWKRLLQAYAPIPTTSTRIKWSGKISYYRSNLNSNNIDVAKQLTHRGMSLTKERVEFIKELSKTVDAEVFEFSTCNRVLFVGFDVDPTTLATGISNMTKLEDIPFQTMTGSNAWRHLVKICSGLDSFIVGELQVMSQLRSSINIHREQSHWYIQSWFL